jgi:hypothetical protein
MDFMKEVTSKLGKVGKVERIIMICPKGKNSIKSHGRTDRWLKWSIAWLASMRP